MVSLLLRNGQIVDGTGSPSYRGSIVVDGDRLALRRGDTSDIRASRTIDATGYVIAPGFIDLHSHAGLTILGQPHHDPKVRQGVTTELVGVDGIGHAPFRSKGELERYIRLDSGLNGRPPREADWLTVLEYLRGFNETVAVNIAYILGASPVRIWAVGWENRRATLAQMDAMEGVVREAMEEGAWGVSTGLDYPPGSFADTAELIRIAQVSARLGGFYHTHTRSALASRGPLEPWKEALEIGQKSDSAVHLTHYRQRRHGSPSHLDYLGLVEDARDAGMDVTFDCYSYPHSSTALTIDLPDWAKDGGPERLLRALSQSRERVRMRSDMHASTSAEHHWAAANYLTGFAVPQNRQYEGESILAIARARNQGPTDAVFDLLVEEDLGLTTVRVGSNEQTLPAFVAHPYGMIASDAIMLGDYPSPRTYGCFPLVLAEFVREGRYLGLPEAVRKMTSFPAQRLGIPDRGILRDGFKADIVMFDPTTVGSPATRESPQQFPVGIDYVIVNGHVVIDEGRNTGALPGRPLYRGRSST